MLELKYRNAFKEVDEILKHTDIYLVNEIPKKFIYFLRANMNNDYKFNVQEGLCLNKQNISEEANNILALIYRDYWATEEEKRELEANDENYISTLEAETEIKFPVNNKANNTTKENENMQLMNIEKVPWYKKIYYKILKLIHKN